MKTFDIVVVVVVVTAVAAVAAVAALLFEPLTEEKAKR